MNRCQAKESFAGERYDSVSGQSGGSDIYMVYDHDKAYPAYLITYGDSTAWRILTVLTIHHILHNTMGKDKTLRKFCAQGYLFWDVVPAYKIKLEGFIECGEYISIQ